MIYFSSMRKKIPQKLSSEAHPFFSNSSRNACYKNERSVLSDCSLHDCECKSTNKVRLSRLSPWFSFYCNQNHSFLAVMQIDTPLLSSCPVETRIQHHPPTVWTGETKENQQTICCFSEKQIHELHIRSWIWVTPTPSMGLSYSTRT